MRRLLAVLDIELAEMDVPILHTKYGVGIWSIRVA